MSNKAQVLRHPCCGAIYAACREPECYLEKDWQRDVRKAAKGGDIIEILEITNEWKLGRCTCKKEVETVNLFEEVQPCQK